MKKGVVIVGNVNVREHNYLKFSSITLNSDSRKKLSMSRDNIQQKLEFFEAKIQQAYTDIILYAAKHPTNSRITLDEINQQHNHYFRDGIPVINRLINQLNHKMLDEEKIKYVHAIIDYQWKITEKMISRPLTEKNLEARFNHLLNVSHYLESDLELDLLPDLSPIDIAIPRNEHEEFVPYDLSKGTNFYNTGA